ncbi:MAG: response regulator [Patescibacteria group bacterium]|jgi:DNA-binding response OmpR family regulator
MANRKKLVLIAEAEQTFSRALNSRLVKAGYEVTTEIDGVRAHTSLKARMPDAIVLDCILPGIRGMDVLKMLKSSKRTKNIPVIFICETDDTTLVKESQKHGASASLRKGHDAIGQIIEEVTRLIQSK